MEDEDFSSLPADCRCGDVMGDAITSWGRAAITYLRETEALVELIHQQFSTRVEMMAYNKEIKYYLRRALSEDDQENLRNTSSLFNKRGQSPDEKLMMTRRQLIIHRLNLLFKKLLDEAFPRMTDDPVFMKSPPSCTND